MLISMIANVITLGRIVISPIFFLIYYQSDFSKGIAPAILLLALLAVSEISDLLDGYLARKYDAVTDLGKVLDPMADSIARISAFLTFTLPPVSLPVWILFIFIYRDSVISTLRTLCALKGIALAARWSGKLKAILQGVASFLITIGLLVYGLGLISLKSLQHNAFIIALVVALYTAASGIEYLVTYRKEIASLLKKRSR